MEDDIFLQLSNLIDGNSSPNFSSGSNHYSAEYGGAPDSTMFAEDSMLSPNIKPMRSSGERRIIVVIDDDFSTLDLMKIYLQRDYDVQVFDNPKNAIFYLNGTIPDLIFIDCYLNVMTTRKVLDILKAYRELAGIPIIYLAEPSEQSAIESKLPEGVLDIISRPVSRGDLQRILDTYIREDEADTENDESNSA